MTPRPGDHVLLDTNILLTATDESRRDHGLAIAALDDWPRSGITCYTSGQILREYLAVASRPIEVNGLGLAMADALANVSALRTRLRLLDESEKVLDRLTDLLTDVRLGGKEVHDANLVATALVHGVDTIVTQNVADFAQFTDSITVAALG